MDISTLKSRTKRIEQLQESLDKMNQGSNNKEDSRFWRVEPDKAGNGSAVIRFLPSKDPNKPDFIRLYTHGFQGPTGKWYIENSLTTLGEEDPVIEYNNALWNSGRQEDRETVSKKTKRRVTFISNVYIVNDPAHPENNGTVKLFKYGKKILDKIKDKAKPTFADESPIDVFDLWEGAEFKLKMIRVDGYANFDKSEFAQKFGKGGQVVPFLDGDEEKIINVMEQTYDLSEFLDRKNFKSYDELKRRLDLVMFPNGKVNKPSIEDLDDNVDLDNSASDDDLSYFQRLAEED